MVFTLTLQMYHRISVLVPVLVPVHEYEYKYEYYHFGTHEYEYKKFSTATKNSAGPIKFDPGQVKIIIDYTRKEIFWTFMGN